MEFVDYYKILGVAEDASSDQIKRAYRKLARKYHPDVSQETDAEARFKEVGEAYDVLKDAEKRSAYDELRLQPHGNQFEAPPGWNYEFRSAGDSTTFSDFFHTFFDADPGSGPFRDGPYARPPRDVHQRFAITLEEAFNGHRAEIEIRTADRSDTRRLKVSIPAGVIDGQHIRLRGQGSGGGSDDQGARGDLYLEIQIAPHPLFSTDGRDIYVTLPVAPWEAALGASIKVPTLGGPVTLKIPAGSQTGRHLRLKGRGLPGSPPGDQYAVLNVVLPPADTEADKARYREMAQSMDFDPRAHLEGAL
jgi:curved DNA-binding protein